MERNDGEKYEPKIVKAPNPRRGGLLMGKKILI